MNIYNDGRSNDCGDGKGQGTHGDGWGMGHAWGELTIQYGNESGDGWGAGDGFGGSGSGYCNDSDGWGAGYGGTSGDGEGSTDQNDYDDGNDWD